MNNPVFEKIKKNFGFGFMRIRTVDDEIDFDNATQMVDAFMEAGFNYFDTAHMYLKKRSESTLRKCLTSRYPRESYVLADKLSSPFFDTEADIRPLFQKQLAECGVDYFDIYLMHAQDRESFIKYKRCRAYEIALELKKEGKLNCFGISFHDKAEVLEQILTEYPQIEVVQIQFNYADFDDAAIESKKCYDVCRKFGKPVIVMEPIKGGMLARLPDEAEAIFHELGGTAASFALRFAASFDGVIMVLSGMTNMDIMNKNIEFMSNFEPLSQEEFEAVDKVRNIFRNQKMIACTACNYCTDGCPKNIRIPELFACMNGKKVWNLWNTGYYYGIHTHDGGKASDCIACKKCENACPQHLPISELMKEVSAEFDNKE